MKTHRTQVKQEGALSTPCCVIPDGTPGWITQELLAHTVKVWQPYCSTPISIEEAVIIVRNAGRLFDALSGK